MDKEQIKQKALILLRTQIEAAKQALEILEAANINLIQYDICKRIDKNIYSFLYDEFKKFNININTFQYESLNLNIQNILINKEPLNIQSIENYFEYYKLNEINLSYQVAIDKFKEILTDKIIFNQKKNTIKFDCKAVNISKYYDGLSVHNNNFTHKYQPIYKFNSFLKSVMIKNGSDLNLNRSDIYKIKMTNYELIKDKVYFEFFKNGKLIIHFKDSQLFKIVIKELEL